MYLCHASWPNEKRYRPEIWYTYSHNPYLKSGFCFFEKMTLGAASLEKLPRHVVFPHISSIALFIVYLFKEFKEKLPYSASLKFHSSGVQSLFINIRLDDTIGKLVTEIFRVSDIYELEGVMFTKDNLKEGLELCVKV